VANLLPGARKADGLGASGSPRPHLLPKGGKISAWRFSFAKPSRPRMRRHGRGKKADSRAVLLVQSRTPPTGQIMVYAAELKKASPPAAEGGQSLSNNRKPPERGGGGRELNPHKEATRSLIGQKAGGGGGGAGGVGLEKGVVSKLILSKLQEGGRSGGARGKGKGKGGKQQRALVRGRNNFKSSTRQKRDPRAGCRRQKRLQRKARKGNMPADEYVTILPGVRRTKLEKRIAIRVGGKRKFATSRGKDDCASSSKGQANA